MRNEVYYLMAQNLNHRVKRFKKILESEVSKDEKFIAINGLYKSYKKYHFKYLVDKDTKFLAHIFEKWTLYRWTIIELSRHGYEIYHPEGAYPNYWLPPQK